MIDLAVREVTKQRDQNTDIFQRYSEPSQRGSFLCLISQNRCTLQHLRKET